MIKKFKVLSLSIFLLSIAYGISYYVISNILVRTLSKYDNIKTEVSTLDFESVSTRGFPFQMILQVKGLKEITHDGINIEYPGYIDLRYKIFSNSLEFFYNDKILFPGNLFAKGILKRTFFLDTNIFSTISNLLNGKGIINNIFKIVISNEDFVVADSEKRKILQKIKKIYLDLEFKNKPMYYSSIEDFLSDLPRNIKISSDSSSEYDANFNLPISLIYAFLPNKKENHAITGDFSFDKLSLLDLTLPKIYDIKLIGNNINTDSLKGDIKFEGKSVFNAEGSYSGSQQMFFNLKFGKEANFLLKEIFPNIKFDLDEVNCKYEVKTLVSDQSKKIKFETFDIFTQNFGLGIIGDVENMQQNLLLKIDVNIVKYKEFIEFIYNYLHKIIPFKVSALKPTLKKFVKLISEHPDSSSDDVHLKINIDTSNGKYQIGSADLSKVMDIFQKAAEENAN